MMILPLQLGWFPTACVSPGISAIRSSGLIACSSSSHRPSQCVHRLASLRYPGVTATGGAGSDRSESISRAPPVPIVTWPMGAEREDQLVRLGAGIDAVHFLPCRSMTPGNSYHIDPA